MWDWTVWVMMWLFMMGGSSIAAGITSWALRRRPAGGMKSMPQCSFCGRVFETDSELQGHLDSIFPAWMIEKRADHVL